MRDVSHKVDTLRTARATATVRTTHKAVIAVKVGSLPKGDAIPVAKVAAIQAAKATANLIPYCHPVPLDFVSVDFEFHEFDIVVTVNVKAIYKTGVEMEALTAASVAALNLYDMIKPIEDDIEIINVRLLEKTGGKSDLIFDGSYNTAVVTISDRASMGIYEDLTGPEVKSALEEHGLKVNHPVVVADEIADIRYAVNRCIDEGARIVVLVGGTGVSARDVTPEALAPMLEKELPAVIQAINEYGKKRKPTAILSRPICGISRGAVILALPGSPSGSLDGIHVVFPALLHALEVFDGHGHIMEKV